MARSRSTAIAYAAVGPSAAARDGDDGGGGGGGGALAEGMNATAVEAPRLGGDSGELGDEPASSGLDASTATVARRAADAGIVTIVAETVGARTMRESERDGDSGGAAGAAVMAVAGRRIRVG